MNAYLRSCPHCGGHLAPHAGGPQDAPWLCNNCARGWWVTELLPEVREQYRPSHHDWGYDVEGRTRIHLGRVAELNAAIGRGTSALPEHLGLLNLAALLALGRRALGKDFAAEVIAAIKARGGKV